MSNDFEGQDAQVWLMGKKNKCGICGWRFETKAWAVEVPGKGLCHEQCAKKHKEKEGDKSNGQ